MSPEQLEGRAIDARCDVFSFGVLLYELATGRRPFHAESSAALASAILRDQPTPPSRLRADLPADLERIIARCLEKDPGRRFSDARELQDALLAVDSDAAPGDERRAEAEAAPRRRPSLGSRTRTPLVLGLIVLVVLVGLSFVFLGRIAPSGKDGPAAEIRSLAVLPFVDLSPDPAGSYLGDGIAETLITNLANVPDLAVAARTSAFSFRGGEHDVREIGRRLGVGAVLEGSVQRVGDRLRVTAQLVDAEKGLDLWSQSFDRDAGDIFAVQDEVAAAVVRELRGRLLTGTSATGTRDADAQLTLPFYSTQPAAPRIAAARRAAERALELDPELAEAQTTLAYLQAMYEWEWRGAERRYQRALELDPDYPNALMHRSWLWWTIGEVERFLDDHEKLAKVLGEGRAPGAELRRAWVEGGREAVVDRLLTSSFVLESPLERARWHVQEGDLDAAFGDLDQALEERPGLLPFVVRFPDLEALRADPRFASVAERLGLAEIDRS